MDHSASLADTADTAHRTVYLKLIGYLLDLGIGSHNSLASRRAVIAKLLNKSRDTRRDRRNIKGLTDNSGRRHDNVLRGYSECISDKLTGLRCYFYTVSVAGVSVSAVTDDCLSNTVCNICFSYRQRRALNEVRSINCRRGGRNFTIYERKILFSFIFSYTAVNTACGKSFCGANAAIYFFHLKNLPIICLYTYIYIIIL